MIRPLALFVVGALAGAGIAFGFQTLRPAAVEPPVDESDNPCAVLEATKAAIADAEVAITDRKADLAELESRAESKIGVPVPWSAEKAATLEADTTKTRTALDAEVGKHGGQVLVLDCSEDPCVQASLFQGPDANAQGFLDAAAQQGHSRVAVLSGNGAEKVPHQLVVRTVGGPDTADGPSAKRIEFRLDDAYSAAVGKITFELVDAKKPQLGWTIRPDEAPADEPEAPAE